MWETRRQVYVYRKGGWGLCVCMLVRGRVLVMKVSGNRVLHDSAIFVLYD